MLWRKFFSVYVVVVNSVWEASRPLWSRRITHRGTTGLCDLCMIMCDSTSCLFDKTEAQQICQIHTRLTIYEPRHEKTCLRGLRPGKTQTSLLSYRRKLESWIFGYRGIILTRQRTTKVLIRLRGCAGWSASLLFAYCINRFPHVVAHIINGCLRFRQGFLYEVYWLQYKLYWCCYAIKSDEHQYTLSGPSLEGDLGEKVSLIWEQIGKSKLYRKTSPWMLLNFSLPESSRLGPDHTAIIIWTASSECSEGSGEPAHPRSLARTSAARSNKQRVKRNLQTESQIPGPSEWLDMRS